MLFLLVSVETSRRRVVWRYLQQSGAQIQRPVVSLDGLKLSFQSINIVDDKFSLVFDQDGSGKSGGFDGMNKILILLL